MRFRDFLERTLYHGTIVDNEPSIRQIGLYGQMGDFQQTAGYDDEIYGEPPSEEDEVVFMTDKKQLDKALTAMVHHIGRKLGKGFHDVTDNDIRNHGLLCIMHDMDASQRPEEEDERGEAYPRGAEPGDYYSSEVRVDKFVKGSGLLRLLKRYGSWPRDYGEEGAERKNKLKGMLTAAIKRQYPQKSPAEILQAIEKNDVNKLARKYLRSLPP